VKHGEFNEPSRAGAESFSRSVKFLVSSNSAFCYGNSYRGFSITEASQLMPQNHIASGNHLRATVTTVKPTTYTGFLREVCAEAAIPGEDSEIDPSMQIMSEFTGKSFLMVVKKNCVGWMAEPLEAKKIIAGQYVVSAPPITPTLQNIARPIKTPFGSFHSVVAVVMAARDTYFRERPMIEVTITGAPGLLCDGFATYSSDVSANSFAGISPAGTHARDLLRSFLTHQETV
jgi:hypothetical protein